MEVVIKKVESQKDLLKFIKSQWNFYKGDPNFVPPLIMDRQKMFNKEKNPLYKHTEIELFLAYRDKEIVGRIAAIKNDNHNTTHNDKIGFFGFFECINDQKVANLLFSTAEAWLKAKGLNVMRGPINPTQNDEVGLFLDGADGQPVCLMTYNPKYYANLIEGYGLSKVKDLLAYLLYREKFMTDKLERMQNIVRERYKVTVRNVNFKDKVQFPKDVRLLKGLYNQAWEANWGFVKMTDEEFDFLAADLKQIAESDFCFIVEINGEPAGFALGLPDINQCLKYNKSGNILTGAWHLLTKKKEIKLIRIIVLGVLPKYQKTGVDAVMYYEFGKRVYKHNILGAEASWILEDNVMMNRALTTTMHGEMYRTYRIYEAPIK